MVFSSIIFAPCKSLRFVVNDIIRCKKPFKNCFLNLTFDFPKRHVPAQKVGVGTAQPVEYLVENHDYKHVSVRLRYSALEITDFVAPLVVPHKQILAL